MFRLNLPIKLIISIEKHGKPQSLVCIIDALKVNSVYLAHCQWIYHVSCLTCFKKYNQTESPKI